MPEQGKNFVIATLNKRDIETYFNVRFAGTSKLKKFSRKLKDISDVELQRLANAMGNEYKTGFYWNDIEYLFETLFLNGD